MTDDRASTVARDKTARPRAVDISSAELDADLARRTAGGDRDAFADLFARYRGAVYRYARQMSGCASLADDVVQDVFVALLGTIQRFDPSRGTLSTYLYGVTRNMVLRAFERRGHRVEIDVESLGEDDAFAVAVRCDPIEALVSAAGVERMRRAIVALPIHHREVVVLCELHERPYEEAAAIIGCPVGTVRSRLSRGRAALVKILTADVPAPSVTHRDPAAAEVRPAARRCCVSVEHVRS